MNKVIYLIQGSLKDDILWLQFRNEPWEEVIDKWRNTFEYRHNTLSGGTVDEFYKQWPVLKDLRAEILVRFSMVKYFLFFNVIFHL